MTRELEIVYSELCPGCKRGFISLNTPLLLRMMDRFSIREVEKLAGIPFSTLRRLRMSESIYKRTSGVKPTDGDKGLFPDIDTAELSQRMKEMNQNGG